MVKAPIKISARHYRGSAAQEKEQFRKAVALARQLTAHINEKAEQEGCVKVAFSELANDFGVSVAFLQNWLEFPDDAGHNAFYVCTQAYEDSLRTKDA